MKVLSSGGREHVEAFLDAQPFGHLQRSDFDTVRGKVEAYVISVYVITMTLTTVGYGDITAENSSERVGYVFFFIVGAFVWGNLLAELNELHQASNMKRTAKLGLVQKTLDFLVEHECPRKLRCVCLNVARGLFV